MMSKIFNKSFILLTTAVLVMSGFFVANTAKAVAPGNVIINEFSSDSSPEWVELLNTTSGPIVLDGWKIQDFTFSGATITGVHDNVIGSVTIPANGIVTVDVVGLNNDADSITLYDNSATPVVINNVIYGTVATQTTTTGLATAPAAGKSGAYISGSWQTNQDPTKGWFNDAQNYTCEQMSSGNPPAYPPTLSSLATCLAADPSYVATNMGSLSNPSAATGLYFEKSISGSPVGRITFAGPLNLTDQNTVNYLKAVGAKMEASQQNGGVKVGLNTSDTSSFSGVVGTVKMYGVTSDTAPSLIVRNNAGNIITSGGEYPTITPGTFDGAADTYEFTTSHFTSFETGTAIDIAAIGGVTAPVTGATPVTTATETAQYTATVSWSGSPSTFAASTVYTATITITPKTSYTLTGVAANFFTVAGTSSSATNNINTGVVTAIFPTTTAVSTYYVDSTGTDDGSHGAATGTSAFKTIQYAIDSAGFGDTINVAAETYAENIKITDKTNLTIQGAGVSTIIEPVSGIGIEVRTSNNITIKNLKVHTTGAAAHGILVDGTGTGGFGTSGGGVSNNLHIENTTIDAGGTGIWGDSSIAGVHSDWFIDHNTITANEGGIGFQDVTNSTVSYNTITTPAVGTNILLTSERYALSTLLIDHNTVSGSSGSEVAVITDYNERDGGIMRESPLVHSTITGITFSNNTFSNWGSRAIRVGQGDDTAIAGTVTGISITGNTFQMTIDTEVIGGTDAPTATGSGNIFNVSGTAKIQKAVTAAFAGDTINVAAGNYTEQVTITKSLNLIGTAGKATTFIVAPDVRSGSVTQGATVHDYVLAAYASSGKIDVRVEGFTIDVNNKNKTAGTARIDGVFFRDVKDAGGSVAGLFSSTIHNFATTPDYEAWGAAIYGDSILTINDNDISDYTRDGLLIIGGNITVSANTITGSALPLNGINIQDATVGSVTGNTVTNNTRSAPWAAGGIVLWASTGVPITGNHVNGNFYGIDLLDGSDGITISGNDLTDNIKRGISLSDSDNNTVKGNTINGPAAGTDDVAIGLSVGSTGNTIGGNAPADGNTITMASSGSANLYAIHVQGDVGTGNNIIRNNIINGGKRAIQIDGGNTGLTTISDNTITNTGGDNFGVGINGGSATISGNTLTNTVRPVEFQGAINVTISGNTINGSVYDGINAGSASGTVKINGDNKIYNIAVNNYGIHVQSGVKNIEIDGNEIYGTFDGTNFGNGKGIGIEEGATGAKITNNNIHNNSWSAIFLNEVVASLIGNTINANARGIETQKSLTASSNKLINTSYCSACLMAAGTFDLSQNWWGTTVLATVTDWIAANDHAVTFVPYYITDVVGDSGILSNIKTITAFTIPSQSGSTTINEGAYTVAITMPYGTDVTALVPTITTNTGASVSPVSLVAHNFTGAQTYTVTSVDEANTQAYTVTITVALNPAKAITAFTIPNQVGNTTIVDNETTHTIGVTMPFGTVATALVPTITTTGASVSPNTGVAHDFSTPQTYTVTAADSTTQPYTITITVLEDTQTAPVTANDGSGDATATVNSDTPEVVITNPDQAVTVTVDNGITNPTIDVGSFMTDNGEKTTGTLPEITINSDVADVVIPDNTVVTGPTDWDGVIDAPTEGTPAGGNPPAGFSVGSTVISIGSDAGTLTFDTAVSIVLPGVTGTVGYRPAGSNTWQTIDTQCNNATDHSNISSGECYFHNGADTIIWTYHFTSFGGLNVISSGGGGGGNTYYSVSVSASAGANGSISPIGSTSVASGNSQTYTITPATGYHVASVLVDGTSVGTVTTYTFSNVTTGHTISATFSIIPAVAGAETKAGDANGDGVVNEYDFALIMSQWGQTGSSLSGDLNKDGTVDEYDFALLMASWGS